MIRLLYVQGSPRGTDSHSAKVADAYLANRKGLDVDRLDLWREPLPEFDGDKAAAKMTMITGGTLEGRAQTAWDAVTAVIDRFTAADEYLFTVPMWNGGVPYRLKLYIDILTQPGLLFGFDPAEGYDGLLAGKKATVVYTSGVYAPGAPPAFGSDFHATFFDDWLRFIGITDIETLRFQPTLLTADYDGALAAAVAEAARAGRGGAVAKAA
jgi:FMN-dependent NADH-azoreductase